MNEERFFLWLNLFVAGVCASAAAYACVVVEPNWWWIPFLLTFLVNVGIAWWAIRELSER